MTWELLLLSAGLSADAFAVAVSDGLCCHDLKKRNMLTLSACFGIFQGLMPLLGYWLGSLFGALMEKTDHWIALILLTYIGLNMIQESLTHEEEKAFTLSMGMTLLQSIAVSIDAFAVGITLTAFGKINIIPAVSLIAIVTGILSLIGVCFGKSIGQKMGSWVRFAGGIILIGIGVRIFISHVFP